MTKKSIKKLGKMGIAEIAFRGRQEVLKWLEQKGWSGKTAPGTILRKILPDMPPGQDRNSMVLLNRFQEGFAERFFDGPANEQTRIFIDRMPEVRGRILKEAEAICQGRFNLLGYHALSFGNPVDWHLDPVSGRRAPMMHWSLLNPLDIELVGDSKVVWELNRHQWMIRLGQAYRLTGDERYAEMFSSYIRDWIRANPPGTGINWASSLEVAYRLISWCWALSLFRGANALSPALLTEMVGKIWLHASHIEKYLSYYFAPNTHLTGEALGLFYAGIFFSEVKPAWHKLGMKILTEQITRHVLQDGVYFEQSTCYQRYTAEIYMNFLILATKNNMAYPQEIGERVQGLLDFLLAVRHPDGTMPQIGDADGGWTLPLVSRTPEDLRGIFSTAAALWDRPDYAWAAGELAPETVWLLGQAGARVFDSLRPAPPVTSPSRVFQQGGYAVMRGGWEGDANQMILDAGPLGCPITGGHGHADLLSIQCAVLGEPLVVDPGTYCYTASSKWRDYFRSTAAHSTVIVDGAEQAAPAGPFHWEKRPRARLDRWISNDKFDFAEASSDAYSCLPDPVIHRRRVLFVKPRYWVVVDDLEGVAEHEVELRFQFAPTKVALETDLWARAQGHRGQELLIRPFALVPLKASVHEGEVSPIQGWVSPDYGQCLPAPVLIYSAETHLPLRIMTLLFPRENAADPIPVVSPILNGGSGPIGLTFCDGNEKIIIRDHEILLNRKHDELREELPI
jgi:hypothetical protein